MFIVLGYARLFRYNARDNGFQWAFTSIATHKISMVPVSPGAVETVGARFCKFYRVMI